MVFRPLRSAAALAAIAVLTSPRVVDAGPCGYGALCGRDACDSATMAAYNAALPKLLACEAYTKPFYLDRITDDAMARKWCFGGPCGDAFDDIVRFYDIERKRCEIHYPSRKENVISGIAYSIRCFDITYGDTLPEFQADMNARLSAARSGGIPPSAPTTTPPPTTAPTTPPLPPPTTAAPTTTPPPTTTAPPPTPEPTPAPTITTIAAANETSSASGKDETEDAIASPGPTSNKPPAPVPSTTKPPASASASKLSVTSSVVMSAVVVFVLAH